MAQPRSASPPDPVQAAIADYALSLDFAKLPADVVRDAKIRLIDTTGALFGGWDGAPCVALRTMAPPAPANHAATILGSSRRTTPDMAALINGAAARYAEMMDVYHHPGSFGGHPSDTVMPVLAVAEAFAASGRDLIVAIVLAYEVFLRLSDKFHNSGFDDTNFSAIAVAASSATLMGCERRGVADAIAMAAVANVVLRQVRADTITMWKVIAAGHAGRNGVFAATMARAGIEGPDRPFTGKGGWLAQVAREPFTLDEWGGGATPFKIAATRLKNRPTAGETISSALAAEKLHDRIDDPSTITGIAVEVYRRALERAATDPGHWTPTSRDAADHSVPYVVAAALLDGRLGVASFDDAHLTNATLRRLIGLVSVTENPAFSADYPGAHRTRITLTFDDGHRETAESGGDADDISTPQGDAQVSAKFMSLASGPLGLVAAQALLDRLWSVETLADVSVLPSLGVIAGAAPP